MRAVVQRVKQSHVSIGKEKRGEIGMGLLILLGIGEADSGNDAVWLAGKISRLRIFPDDAGVMNRSVMDVEGSLLVVSQFTLHASTKKGNRPFYGKSAEPEKAIPLYEKFISELETITGKKVQTGEFGAMMEVYLINDGPVTIIIDSKNPE